MADDYWLGGSISDSDTGALPAWQGKKKTTDEPPAVQIQAGEPEQTQEVTQPTEAPTEAARVIPDGTVLAEGS